MIPLIFGPPRVRQPPASTAPLNQPQTIKPPTPLIYRNNVRIFLAGSIEQGKAVDWQAQLEKTINERIYTKRIRYNGALGDPLGVTFLNPRRDQWDANLEQSFTNSTFRGQVEWELQGIEDADIVVMYLQSGTMSPISLLELGLVSGFNRMVELTKNKTLIVLCPKGFWRKGNVDVMCHRYNAIQVDSFTELEDTLLQQIEEVNKDKPRNRLTLIGHLAKTLFTIGDRGKIFTNGIIVGVCLSYLAATAFGGIKRSLGR